MHVLEQQHQQELIQVRARIFEFNKREQELVVILNTFAALRQHEQKADASPRPAPETAP